MKIKGAFPVRWAAQNGNDGKGVTIVKTEIKYAVSTSGTTKPSSGWQTTIPSVSEGNYLWTWTHVEYSDGTKTDAYTTARQGVDGKGIKSSQVTYSLQASNVNPESITNWGAFPSALTDGYWLYTRTVITYSEGDTTTSYSVSQVGVGSYYAGVEEYYAAGDSATVAPSGAAAQGTYTSGQTIQTTWKQERPTLNASTPYLWNFEISSDSRGNRYVTDSRCIGNFAKGIVSIVETYAISAQGNVPQGRDYPSDIAEADWKDEHFAAAPTNDKPYQWNKTVTTYNDGTTNTIYHVSAVKGIDGKGTVYVDLDNENDSILYDGQGNRVGGSVTSNIRLYENGSDITSGKTFTISSKSSTVNASISGSVLTVTGITSNDGYVIVRCVYNSVSYYARFTVKRLVGVDKYEVVCTPSAITLNTDTGTARNTTVTVEVYRTAQNGTRTHLQTLPTGYTVKRKWTDTVRGTAMDYADGKATFKPYDDLHDRYRVELADANGVVLDYETIPICRVKDGAKGDSAFVLDADNENVGFIVEDTGIYSTAQTREIGISAYYGANPASGVEYSVSVEGNTDASGSNYLSVGSVTNGKLSISLQDAIAWKKDTVVKITVTATHATYGTRSIVINCVPVFGGAKADYYDLLPSLSAITFTKTSDGKSLTPSSRTLTVQCLHVTSTGQTPVSIPSGYSVRYSYTSQPTTSTSGSAFPSAGLPITSATSNTIVYLSLFKGTTLIDKESVPIIKGGVDGADNIGVSINLNNDMSSFPMTYAGRTTGNTTHANHVALYIGNSLQAITSLEIEVSDSSVTYNITPASGGVYAGDFEINVPNAKSFTADKVTAKITVKSAECTEGRSILFTMQGVRAGCEGKSAILYELMPSVTEISFGRDGNNNLTPTSINVNCGYQKNDGGTITNYSGIVKANLWKSGGAPYNMMYRFQQSDGTYTALAWAKDLTNPVGTVVIRNTSTHLALEYILTSAESTTTVSDSNIVDRETIPIVRGGSKGGNGDSATNYWLVPSDEEVHRYQTAQLSVDKLTCTAKKKTGTGDALNASDVTIYYQYVELGVKSNETHYTSSGVELGLWWSEITFIGKVNGSEVARKTVYFKNAAAGIGDNILNGTNFEDPKDAGTTYNDSDILASGVGGVVGIKSDGFLATEASYKNIFETAIHGGSDNRLMPSTWYTLSFWAMAEDYLHITVGETKAQYGFAGQTAFFTKGSHKIIINGYISTAAKNAGKELRVFVYKSDWSWEKSVATLSTSATNFVLTFEIPHDGDYEIRAYVYHATDKIISSTSYTATVNWYRVYSPTVRTHIYNSNGGGSSSVDTSFLQVADGVANRGGKPADGNCNFDLTSDWTFHTFTFRTKATLPTEGTHIALFRHAVGTSRCAICRMKLERGIFATDWSRSEHDKTGGAGVDGCIMRTTEWAKGVEYHNDSALTTGTRFLDIICVGVGTSSVERYMCRVTHTSTDANKPNGSTSTYWQKLDNNFPIYTPLIMADNALLRFTQTNQLVVADTNGSIIGRMGGGEYLLALGSATPANAPFRVKKDGSFVGNKAILNNAEVSGKIVGSVRNPFVSAGDSFDTNYSDNVAIISYGGGWIYAYSLPWDVQQSGRIIRLVNYKFGTDIAEGSSSISAPNGKYFYEDGISKTTLNLSRECIELLGYGTENEFYGWIVLNRLNLMTTKRYGRNFNVLAMGKVTGTNSTNSTSITYKTFDNTTLTVARLNTGLYRIYVPSEWNLRNDEYLVLLSGYGYVYNNSSSPAKATLIAATSEYFDVRVSDDASSNDGSFMFTVTNMQDWVGI